jgi:opacity protein-like surface antigen
MNKKSLALMILSTATLTSQPLLADSTHGSRYVGGSIGFMDIDGGGSEDASINTIEGRIGGYMNDYVAVETRLGVGLTDDTVNDVDFSLRYSLGAYVRAGFPVTEQVFPYVILGFSRADFEAKAGGSTVTEAETDSSYGIGIDVEVVNLALTAEYLNMIDKNDTTFSGFSVGFTTKF